MKRADKVVIPDNYDAYAAIVKERETNERFKKLEDRLKVLEKQLLDK